MASQIPAGALVDAIRSKARAWRCFSILAFTASALLFAIWPAPLLVYVAEMLHGFSSCTLGPAIAAMSLAVAGPAALGARLGRNARFASIGNGIGAALMGACGYYVSERAVFFLTAALTLPALAALRAARRGRSTRRAAAPARARAADPARAICHCSPTARLVDLRALRRCSSPSANAAMLPLAGSTLTKRAGSRPAC